MGSMVWQDVKRTPFYHVSRGMGMRKSRVSRGRGVRHCGERSEASMPRPCQSVMRKCGPSDERGEAG